MALNGYDITFSDVKEALGVTKSFDLGVLCTNRFISPWSRWKPIRSAVTILNDTELQAKHYGLEILTDYTPQRLYNKIVSNLNKGYKYLRPRGGNYNEYYRLGDFRHYEHNALPPFNAMYSEGQQVKIGGVTSTYEVTIESALNLNTPDALTTSELFEYFNEETGAYKTLQNRGICFIVDGTYMWFVGSIPYGRIKNTLIGKTVTTFEFVTNLDNGTTYERHLINTSDIFKALPFPLYNLTFVDEQPSSSVKVISHLNSTYSTDNSKVSFSVYFDATDDTCSGGTLSNVYVFLSTTYECANSDRVGTKSLGNITVNKGSKSATYTGTFDNIKDNNGEYRTDLYVCLWYDNVRQISQVPLLIQTS